MAEEPEPPKPINWKVYKIANKLVWLGDVEAPDEAAAMEKAAVEFKVPANGLMVITLSKISAADPLWTCAENVAAGSSTSRSRS